MDIGYRDAVIESVLEQLQATLGDQALDLRVAAALEEAFDKGFEHADDLHRTMNVLADHIAPLKP